MTIDLDNRQPPLLGGRLSKSVNMTFLWHKRSKSVECFHPEYFGAWRRHSFLVNQTHAI